MTTPRPRLTRQEAGRVFELSGYGNGLFRTNLNVDVPLRLLMVGIAEAESGLYVDAQGPPNNDGTVDRGFLQINSVHGYDDTLLLSDPGYTARCAFQILTRQGIRAWAAYNVRDSAGNYPYARRMPPGYGGPTLTLGARGELVRSVQGFLTIPADGSWGSGTDAAIKAWKAKHHNDGTTNIDARTWQAMARQGLF